MHISEQFSCMFCLLYSIVHVRKIVKIVLSDTQCKHECLKVFICCLDGVTIELNCCYMFHVFGIYTSLFMNMIYGLLFLIRCTYVCLMLLFIKTDIMVYQQVCLCGIWLFIIHVSINDAYCVDSICFRWSPVCYA